MIMVWRAARALQRNSCGKSARKALWRLFAPALVDTPYDARRRSVGGQIPGRRGRKDPAQRQLLGDCLVGGFGGCVGKLDNRCGGDGRLLDLAHLDGPVSREETGEHRGQEKQQFQVGNPAGRSPRAPRRDT